MRSEEYVYTDVAFEHVRSRHTKRTVEVAMVLIAINAAWWAYFAYLHAQWAMLKVDLAGAAAAMAVLGMSRLLKSAPATPHLGMMVGVTFIWAFIVVVEGIPGGRFPILNHWWFLATGMAASLLFVDSARWRLAYTAVSLLSFAVCGLSLVSFPAIGPLTEAAAAAMFPTMSAGVQIGVFLTTLLMASVFIASIAQAEKQLRIANDKLEGLLNNMLPRAIADRLRKEGKTFADGHAECSVLFVDIVGFTNLTTKLEPQDLVRLLNEIFTRFDELTEEMGLEKIKTIGDAYMVASGLPNPRADHATACVSLAIRMREAIREYADLNVRIGINSGSVVAGVIGKRRFIYDLWGDTVNIASRMESQGVVDGIQVSERTAELVKDDFVLKPHGEVVLKGRGAASVFLVVGKHVVRPERAASREHQSVL